MPNFINFLPPSLCTFHQTLAENHHKEWTTKGIVTFVWWTISHTWWNSIPVPSSYKWHSKTILQPAAITLKTLKSRSPMYHLPLTNNSLTKNPLPKIIQPLGVMDSLKSRPKILDSNSMAKNWSKQRKSLLSKLSLTMNNSSDNSALMTIFKKKFTFRHKNHPIKWISLTLKKKISLLLLKRRKRRMILDLTIKVKN